jgi:hypothetical protein
VHYTPIFTALSHIKSPNLLNASSLADFSAIGHFHRLSHTVANAKFSLHTASRLRYLLRKALAEIWLRCEISEATRLENCCSTTDCLDISVPLINPQSYERHCCLLSGPSRSSGQGGGCVESGHCVYRSCLGNKRVAVWRHRGLLCSSARWGSARHGTARSKHRFPYCGGACIRSRGV